MHTEGIFRITGSDPKIRELELHISKGNYLFLPSVKSPHTVTNYWKRVLREMKQPLIPFDLYYNFEQIGEITQQTSTKETQVDIIMLMNIKFMLNKLPDLNYNTLKYHIEFFDEVTMSEPFNKMTAYNLAVTVGPNIFRPEQNSAKDLVNVGIFYELIITMIQNHKELFDKSLSYDDLIEKWAKNAIQDSNFLEKERTESSNVGMVFGQEGQTLTALLNPSTISEETKV